MTLLDENSIPPKELLLDSGCFSELLLVSGSFSELLDFSVDSDVTELDEDSIKLLLDFPDFSLELDCSASLRVSLDEDFAFSLLDEFFWALELDELCSAEEEDSTPGSSFGPADADELSSHPTNANATKPIARINFFINPPVTRYNKFKANVIYST